MTGWTEEDIRRQFQRAKKGWLQTFKKAAEKYDFPPEVLLAIASRETNCATSLVMEDMGMHHAN